MFKIAFRFVFSLVLFLVPVASLQAQLFGPHRVKLLARDCRTDVNYCVSDCCSTVSSQVDSCRSVDRCELQREEDTRLVQKYFGHDAMRLAVLMEHVESRYNRCRAGEILGSWCKQDPDPVSAELCWSTLERCKRTNPNHNFCEDQFFSCLRDLEGPGGPGTCYIDNSSSICYTPIQSCPAKRRCFGLFNRVSRLRCR